MKRRDNSIFLTYKEQVQNAIDDLKTKGKRYRQIPNLLTLMRLTAPCFIIPTAAIGNVPFVLGLTIFFSLTDLADGFIARNFKLTSELGATLDAITDKVFASTLLLAASFANPLLLCNLGLECCIAGINTYKKLNNIPVKSSMIGKAKTWFLFGLAGAGMLSSMLDIVSILNTLMVTTTAMQIFTIASYLVPNLSNQSSKLIVEEEKESFVVPTFDDSKQKELPKEKVLEVDTSVSKIQNKSVRKLNEMKDFLISEQSFLGLEDNKQVETNNFIKSKEDDFNKK